MRSLKRVKYDELVVGEWYSCIFDNDIWYFKFLQYSTNGGVMTEECYSPYNNTNEVFYSKLGSEITENSKDKINQLRGVNYMWLMENVVNGRIII
jgi:hypothetical protein